MANPEHLEILKQGVEVWNRWREESRKGKPDFYKSDLSRLNLSGANLSTAILSEADLSDANLTGAILSGTKIFGTNMSDANLNEAYFVGAELFKVSLFGAKFRHSTFWNTWVVDVDLSGARDLETVKHRGPSYIDISTIYASEGKIPKPFLRGCGVPESFIHYMPSLVKKGTELSSCFISYSSKDRDFSERLHVDLQEKGARCWFAPEDMKIGDNIRDRIDQSIQLHDKLLLVLSDHSINSEWVEDEVESAYEQEKKRNKTVLFPIRLDDAVMDTDKAWASKLRRSRHIGDFINWKNHDSYQKAFDRLLRDLKAEPESK